MLQAVKIAWEDKTAIALKGYAPKTWRDFIAAHGAKWQPNLVCYVYPAQPLPEPILALLAAQRDLDPNTAERVLDGHYTLSKSALEAVAPVEPKVHKARKPIKPNMPAKNTPADALRKAGQSLQARIDICRAERPIDTNKRRAEVERFLREAWRLELLQDKLFALADAWDANTITPRLELLRSKKLVEHVILHGNFNPTAESHAWLKKAGIRDEAHMQQLATDLKRIGNPQAGQPTEADKILQQRIEVAQRAKGIKDFFPTPPDAIEMMIARADLWEGQRVLEPSAGSGNILDALRALPYTLSLYAVEQNYDLHKLLELKGYNASHEDFMSLRPEDIGVFDRILMNPPFSAITGVGYQDIQHVMHAYNFLKEGGTLVAIVSRATFTRADKRTNAFREWFYSMKGDFEHLPAGTFREGDVPTSVETSVLWIHK